MTTNNINVARLAAIEKIPFAENSAYQPILNGEAQGLPIFTGIQSAEPGYQTKAHQHPYVEVLHILEGIAEAWLVGKENEKVRLMPGDTITLPANHSHIFRAVGNKTLRLLGTHLSPQRIVNFDDGKQSVMGKGDE
jgi:mannose-6-phosphate isomerase-like protein (cupin superfamily)